MNLHPHGAQRAPAIPLTERALIAEKLRLALDEIESGEGDMLSIRNAVGFQRDALRASNRRLDRMMGRA